MFEALSNEPTFIKIWEGGWKFFYFSVQLSMEWPPCNPPNYGLWVNLLFFMMCIYKLCFPPMLRVLAMKCCTKMPCPLPHNQPLLLLTFFTYMLASPAHLCMPHLFTHCLPTIICVMLMSIALFLIDLDIWQPWMDCTCCIVHYTWRIWLQYCCLKPSPTLVV